MELMLFPFERVVEINAHILSREPGMRGSIDLNKLRGALGRIDKSSGGQLCELGQKARPDPTNLREGLNF